MRILLIDDHADSLTALCMSLQVRRHQVTTAGSFAAGLSRLSAESFDLMICELRFAGGDGAELAEVAQALGTRAVALSSQGTTADLARAKRSGFSAHLLKPVTLDQLDHALSGAASELASTLKG